MWSVSQVELFSVLRGGLNELGKLLNFWEKVEGVAIGGKRERNLKEGGNMKFIVPASLTLEKNAI